MPAKRKLQVSNSYPLQFDQLSKILYFLAGNPSLKKVSRKILVENTGLSDRQIEGLVSIGSAMGLIQPVIQILTPRGRLIAQRDIYFQQKGTLEWCHFKGTGSFQNLIWYELFNSYLPDTPPSSPSDWLSYFRGKLTGQYSKKTLAEHLRAEVHFIADAYFNQELKRLQILNQTLEGAIYLIRYSKSEPLVFCAMLYEYGEINKSTLFQITDLVTTKGSPAKVFHLDEPLLRQIIDGLHEKGWVRYERTHNLDQIRLKESYSSLDFLEAFYQKREPRQGT